MTRFERGSLKQILFLSIPLMLSCLSGSLMYFVDRLILANYSELAMNAATNAGMFAALFNYGGVAIAGMAEVFVGQFNGAKQIRKTPVAVWQMIYFSLALSLIFVPMGLFSGELFVAKPLEAEGVPYFRWVMGFGFLYPLTAALSAFFIGLGRPIPVTIATIVSNVANALLDFIFIFGVEGWLSPMGAQGAAIATVISLFLQAAFLFAIYLNRHNRQIYGTHDFRVDFKIIKECLRIGYPNAFGHIIEIGAWAVLSPIVIVKGLAYASVVSIGQSIFILFLFMMEGMQKAITAIASNLIGEKKQEVISLLLKNAIYLHLGIIALLALPMLVYPEPLINLFIGEHMSSDPDLIMKYAKKALFWVWVFTAVDGMTWAISGVFTSAGDTLFIMLSNAFSSWGFAIIPLYFVIQIYDVSPTFSWQLIALYGVMNLIFFGYRYRSKKWLKFNITDKDL